MSATSDKIASKLAEETMAVMDLTGDERFYMKVAQTIGAASQTLEESFLTEIRVRMAGRKAMAMIQAAKKSAE